MTIDINDKEVSVNTHTHTLTLTLTHTHTHTYTIHTHIDYHTHACTHSLSQIRRVTESHTLTNKQTHTHLHTFSKKYELTRNNETTLESVYRLQSGDGLQCLVVPKKEILLNLLF